MTKVSEKLFFLSYGIYLVFCILNASFYNIYICNYQKITMVLCTIIIIFSELIKKKLNKKELILLIFCGILFSILLNHINGFAMFPLLFFMYSSRRIEFKKIAKFTVIVSSISLIFIVISAMLGIITNYQIVQVLFGVTRTRTYLGFRYPLYPQMILFNITLCYLYLHKDNISLIKCIMVVILNYWMYTYTNARLSCYLSIILTFVVYIFSKKPRIIENRKIISFILIFSFPICALLSIGVTMNYNPASSTMTRLDEFLGGRLNLGKSSLSEYKINLFGQDTEYIGAGLNGYGKRTVGTYNYVDCLYINMLEKYGIIYNLILLGLLTFLLYKLWKDKEYILFIIMVGVAVHGIIDDLGIYLYYNAFWLAISSYFINYKEKKKEKDTKNELVEF